MSHREELVARISSAMALSGIGRPELTSRSGLSNSYIGQLLTGRIQSPRLDAGQRLAKGLGVPVAWLLWGSGVTPSLPMRARRKPWVYFVQRTTDGAVKIGTSVDPRARLMALRTASADELVLVAVTSGGHKLERQLHLRFSIQRLNGEWFRPSDELRSLIESLEKKAA